MTLRALPEISVQALSGALDWEVPSEALSRWNDVHAAADGSDDNTISVLDVIGEDFWTGTGVTAKRVAAALRQIGARDVVVNVNSPGGDFFEGLAIYNTLRAHPHKVTIRVLGLAASAASVIAMAGDVVQVPKAGFIMIHNAWGVVMGDRNDLAAAVDVLKPFDAAMAQVYAARSSMKVEELAALMDKETWFNGDAAIDAGLADELLPADQVSEAKASAQNNQVLARRTIEAALAKQKIPRRERAKLLAEVRGGARDAAPNVKREADAETVAAMQRFLATLST